MKLFILLGLHNFVGHTQNLVSNPDFDSEINNWDPNYHNSVWANNEGGPLTGNGSLRFARSLHNNATVYTASE